jgi:hypothetical protein
MRTKHITNVLLLRMFYVASCININKNTVLYNNTFSNVYDLMNTLQNSVVQYNRFKYYGKVIKSYINSALSYNILPISDLGFTRNELYRLVMLLLSTDIEIRHIRYSDIVRILLRGKSYEFDSNDDDRQSKYMYTGKKNKYTQLPANVSNVGVLDTYLFDLSFFLKLNYDLDLYQFIVFCKFACAESATLSGAL